VYSCTKYIATGWIEYTGIRKNYPESPVIYDEEKDFAISKKPQLSNWDSEDNNNDSQVFIPNDLSDIPIDFGDRKI
jgi:hypothetical protein